MGSYALFDTPYGRCGIAWGDRGIAAIALPQKSDAQLRRRLQTRVPDAQLTPPPPQVQRAIDDVLSHLRGDPVDLSSHVIDLEGLSVAARAAYEAVRAIPVGETRTYGELRIGTPRTLRAALDANPIAFLVPHHRVLGQDGRFAGDPTARMRILTTEAPHAREGGGSFAFAIPDALAVLRRDPRMKKIVDEVPFRMSLRGTPSLFVALMEAIVYQQLSGRAAGTILARVRALFPHGHLGPTPEQFAKATDDALLGAGLSRNKLLALRDLCRHALDGTIPTMSEAAALGDETLIDRLTEVRGIGRWTVEMLLMFRLGRPDLLPVDDLGVRKGYMMAYGKRRMPTLAELAKAGEKWRPYRTIASWYLWRASERPKQR